MPTKTAVTTTPATRAATLTPIEAAAIRKRKAQRAIDAARVQNPYTSYARDELTLEFTAATRELEELVDAAIAAGE